MSGENSNKSGNDGQKIVIQLLKLAGWTSVTPPIQFPCSLGLEHSVKEGSKKYNHNIDGFYQYSSPLIHKHHDIIFISSKHSQKSYSYIKDNINDHIEDICKSLECGAISEEISEYVEKNEFIKNYLGVLFLIASDKDKNTDIVKEIEDSIKTPKFNFETLYIVDNKRATFLLSAINTAQEFNPRAKLKFIFPDTGRNHENESLLLSDTFMPIQYINSSILPIVLENENKISCLIFSIDAFEKDSLKRLIWFAHKVIGYTNEIVIFFPDYDETPHSKDVLSIKQLFKDTDFMMKISVRRYNQYDFITLKQDIPEKESIILKNENRKIELSAKVKNEIDKYLPFGKEIAPLISSTMLSNSDLKEFLLSKGILINSSDKNNTVPLFSSLLLSPRELDLLRNMLAEKEDRPKTVERNAKFSDTNKTLWEVLSKIGFDSNSINLPPNCHFTYKPAFKREDKNNPNEVFLEYEIERENTTKDLLTGKTIHSGRISFNLKNQNLSSELEYTAPQTYDLNIKIFSSIEKSLKSDGYIKEEFDKITFSDFNNESRIDFFRSFLETKGNKVFYDPNIETLKIKPDSSSSNLPKDLEVMKGKVRILNIDGNKLDDLPHVSKDEYKKNILCEKIKIKYKFKFKETEGICYVDICFPNVLTSDKTETEFQTSIILPRSKKFLDVAKELNKFLTREFNLLKENKIKKYRK